MSRYLAAVTLLIALCVSAPTWAQAPGGDAAAAEVLFREGRDLYEAGELEAASAKFAASFELDSGLGALLNLARCYKELGRTASAWGAYTQLSGLAQRAGQSDRVKIADEEASALEPKLIRVKLRVAGEGVEVKLDQETWPPAAWDSARPLDPGTHRLVAQRDGEAYWERRLLLEEPGTTLVVEVPAPPAQTLPTPVPAAPPPPPMPTPTRGPAPPGPVDTPVWPWFVTGGVTGGLGLVGLGIAGGFAADASSAWSEAGCEMGLCPDADAQTAAERAGRSADLATGFAVGGGLLATAGLVFTLVGLLDENDPVQVGGQGLRLRF